MRSKYSFLKTITCLLILSSIYLLSTTKVESAPLTSVSDTLSNPRPNEPSNHTWSFVVTNTIPVSGKIIITPKANEFNIPATMDSFDFDLAVNGSEKALASTPGTGSGSAIGVTITSGTSGNITFTLNNSDTIPSGNTVVIKGGTNAVISGGGIRQITNPSTQGSYTYTITTKDAGNVEIDTKTGGIAIVPSVGITSNYNPQVDTPTMNPVSQSFSTSTTVSISTTTIGASIYYTTDGTTPSSSSSLYTTPLTFTSTTTLKAIGILAGIGDSDIATEIYVLSVPSTGGGGGGSGGGGSGLILPPFVTPVIYTNSNGEAIAGPEPARIIHTCPNGAILTIDLPKNFWLIPVKFTITCLSRSAVEPTNPINFPGQIVADTVFSIKAEDSKGKIEKLLLPSIIQMQYSPGHLLDFSINSLVGYESLPKNLPWKSIAGLGTTAETRSIFGTWQTPGLYTSAGPKQIKDCSTRKADLNCDNHVNLTDLSILLYNWEGPKNNPKSDISKDGKVDLTDFSILLYYWTD